MVFLSTRDIVRFFPVRTSWRTRFRRRAAGTATEGTPPPKPTRNHVPWATDCGNGINRTVDTCVQMFVGGREHKMTITIFRTYSDIQIFRCSGMEFREGPPTARTGRWTQCPVVHGDEFITRLLYTVTAGHTRERQRHMAKGERTAVNDDAPLSTRRHSATNE